MRVVMPSPGADKVAAAAAEQVLESAFGRRQAVDDGVPYPSGPRGAAVAVSVDDGTPQRLRLEPAGKS